MKTLARSWANITVVLYIGNITMKKALVAAVLLGASSLASAAIIPSFTVDPFNAFGAPQPGAFQANFITGNGSTLIQTGALAPNATGAGWVNFSAFVDNGVNVLGFVSGLNNTWQLWGETTFDLTLTSGAYGLPNSTYDITNLHIDFWADPSLATPTTFVSSTAAGGAATVTHGAGSVLIGTSEVIVGVAAINAQGGTAINSTNAFALSGFGSTLFTAPSPFFTLSFLEGNNTSSGVVIDPAGQFIATNQATSGVDFALVPEPSVLALIGIGMLGLFARRSAVKGS